MSKKTRRSIRLMSMFISDKPEWIVKGELKMYRDILRLVRQSLERLERTEIDKEADEILDDIFNEAEKIIYIVKSL